MNRSSKVLSAFLALVFASTNASAQHSHTDATAAVMSANDMSAMAAHMAMTPGRRAIAADSSRANEVVGDLRSAISKYRDVGVAEADGFRMFAPQLKNQRVYHFTKNLWALENQFTFSAARPTSLLYRKDARGNFVLVGAMYTAPKRYSAGDLDKRIPTSIARWHKHVNWCLPPRRADERWTEIRNGRPVFGPLGVATRAECDAVDGRFVKEIFGWMVHANVFASDDPSVIWGDEHMRGDEMMDRHSEESRR
jgi:hypothetical protein